MSQDLSFTQNFETFWISVKFFQGPMWYNCAFFKGYLFKMKEGKYLACWSDETAEFLLSIVTFLDENACL